MLSCNNTYFFSFTVARLAIEIAFAVEEMKTYGGLCCESSFSSPLKNEKVNTFQVKKMYFK